MIANPIFAFLFLFLLITLGVAEVRYYRAGSPKSLKWVSFLFLCGACTAVTGAFALIPKVPAMFQNGGTIIALLIAALVGGLGAVYTGPKYAREAEKMHQKKNEGG